MKEENVKKLDTFTKIGLIILGILFTYAIYTTIEQEIAWQSETKFTKAITHVWSVQGKDSTPTIVYTYMVNNKEYTGTIHAANYRKSYDKYCIYLVEYPIKYPEHGIIRLDSCINR